MNETDLIESKVSSLRIINVLIVDDSGACRLMIDRALKSIIKEGCRICCYHASDGVKAVEKINTNISTQNDVFSPQISPITTTTTTTTNVMESCTTSSASKKYVYDLILMDYQMPHMDGPTAIRRIRELGFQGQIVGLTGNVLGSEIETMRQAGANNVLAKPVQLSLLESVIFQL